MSKRHLLLALTLAVAGLTAGGASVLADDEHELRREVHVVRDHDPVVIDRAATLRTLDRVLDGIDAVAELTPVRPGRGPYRRLVDDGAEDRAARHDDARDERERPGARPYEHDERNELHRVPPPGADRRVEERLDGMRRELLALRRAVLRAPEVLPPPRVVRPMEDRAFRRFLGDIGRAPFADDRVALVEDVALHAHFTSEQARLVVSAIQSWGQVDAAVALYPRIVDPQSFHLVVNALAFGSDRAELRRRIRR